jgi:hypothetical protein
VGWRRRRLERETVESLRLETHEESRVPGLEIDLMLPPGAEPTGDASRLERRRPQVPEIELRRTSQQPRAPEVEELLGESVEEFLEVDGLEHDGSP